MKFVTHQKFLLKKYTQRWILHWSHFREGASKKKSEFVTNFSSLNRAILFIAHSNCLRVMGGTEKVILMEIEENYAKENLPFIILFPVRHQSRILQPATKFGVIVNGILTEEILAYDLQNFVDKLNVSEVRVHHLFGWPLQRSTQVLKSFQGKGIKVRLYLHDFLYRCPYINSFCFNGDKRCSRILGSKLVLKWREYFSEIMKTADEILVPSEFLRQHVDLTFQNKVKVTPFPLIPQAPVKKLTLAFLGMPLDLKGYDVWTRLAQNALITRKFDLFQLAEKESNLKHVQTLLCSYHSSRENKTVQLLQENKIQYVLLWSRVSESYSFTMHEAMAAGSFVITSINSGNIAYTIASVPDQGVILADEGKLLNFLMKLRL
jgi:hypothetical protein